MKIALQITTATLGDMVIEEADDKTTTNPYDQKSIVVELLVQALGKVVAAYKIPKEMLDLDDEDGPYQTAHARKVEQDKEPKYSSAEANRLALQVTSGSEEPLHRLCTGCDGPCVAEESEVDNEPEGTCCCPHTHPKNDIEEEEDDSEDMIITEEELV